MRSEHILLLTRRFGYNFGSSLQAYAMNKLLSEHIEDVSVADYDENNASIRWRFRGWFDSFFSFFFFCFPFLRIFKKNYCHYLSVRKKQINEFRLFEKKYLDLTRTRFRNSRHLKQHVDQYDTFVCGSDQIWCPLLWDPVFFLDFVSGKEKKKIAYAPSFGIAKLETHQEDIKGFLSDFHRISVREESGAEIIKHLLGEKPLTVVDPTLLLKKDYWNTLADTESCQLPSTPYIACYFLGKNIPYAFLKEIQEETGYLIINLMTFRTMNNIKGEEVFPGPDGFVRYISHAAFVCTDSFHATVFSIIFDRDFYTFRRFKSGERLDQNTRLDSLFCTQRSKERFLARDAHYNAEERFLPSDKEELKKKLFERISKSDSFLKEALGLSN